MCVSVRACRYWHASPWATPNCLFSPLQLARAAGMARCGGPGSLLRTVVVASVCTQGTHVAHRPGSRPCWGTTRFSHVWPAAGVHLWLGQGQNSLCGDGEMILKTTEKKEEPNGVLDGRCPLLPVLAMCEAPGALLLQVPRCRAFCCMPLVAPRSALQQWACGRLWPGSLSAGTGVTRRLPALSHLTSTSWVF